jgi:DNA-binding IclR family transcriptional regulator
MNGEGSPSTTETAHVARTLRALELLTQRPRSASDVAQALGVHRRTANRLLESLVAEGYVVRPPGGAVEFEATMKIVGLAGRFVDRNDLVQIAFPYVTRLRNLAGEAAHLSVPTDEGVMHLLQETGENVVMVKPRVGELVAYHSTAVGKALLAHSPAIAEKTLSRPLEAFTEHTITDPAELLVELSRIRSRAYAVDELENTLDLRCVAAPVFDHNAEVVAALGISAPALRLQASQVPGAGAAVVEFAASLSEALGFAYRREKLVTTSPQPNIELVARITEEDAHG